MSETVKKKENKTVKYVMGILISVIFVLCIYILIAGTIALKENRMMRIFGYSYSIVPTSSMEPTIKTGSIIIIDDTPYSELKKGDIIVYYNPDIVIGNVKGAFISHKIIGTFTDGTFQTQGDNKVTNNSPDDFHVTEESYFGKVVDWTYLFGVGTLVTSKRNIIFVLIIIIFSYLMINEIFNVIKIVKEKQKLEASQNKNIDIDSERERLRQEVLKELEEEKNKKNNE